tara:strand:+ start:77 stop:184 length:108 start_codon:yes stop_codon:yes gene_type:complete
MDSDTGFVDALFHTVFAGPRVIVETFLIKAALLLA